MGGEMGIGRLADRLERAGDRLTAAAAGLTDLDLGAAAFGADQPGRLGEVGRALHHRWSTALTARAREAAAHGARLTAGADLLRVAAQRYRDAEAAAESRHQAESP